MSKYSGRYATWFLEPLSAQVSLNTTWHASICPHLWEFPKIGDPNKHLFASGLGKSAEEGDRQQP